MNQHLVLVDELSMRIRIVVKKIIISSRGKRLLLSIVLFFSLSTELVICVEYDNCECIVTHDNGKYSLDS